jgi:hypothetical protein
MGLSVILVINTVAAKNQLYTGKQFKNKRKGFGQQTGYVLDRTVTCKGHDH